MFRTALAGLMGYLIGSLPSADAAARAATGGSVDLRTAGTGNPGAANAGQVLGRGWGAAVIVADTGKGAIAALAGRRWAGDGGGYAAGTGAVLGHVFPVWSRFRGGKGIATSGGASLALFPVYVPVDMVTVSATARATAGRLHLGMTATCAAWVAASAIWCRRALPNAWGPAPSKGLLGFTAISSAAIVWRFWEQRSRSSP